MTSCQYSLVKVEDLDTMRQGIRTTIRLLSDLEGCTGQLMTAYYDPSLTAYQIGINEARRRQAEGGEQPSIKQGVPTKSTPLSEILEPLNIRCLHI